MWKGPKTIVMCGELTHYLTAGSSTTSLLASAYESGHGLPIRSISSAVVGGRQGWESSSHQSCEKLVTVV